MILHGKDQNLLEDFFEQSLSFDLSSASSSLMVLSPPPEPAPGWSRISQTSQMMNSNDKNDGKRLYIDTSQLETLPSPSTTTMLYNKKSVGSEMICSQYVRRSHREGLPLSIMSKTEMPSEGWRETSWTESTSLTGMGSGQRSPASLPQYEQTPSFPPQSLESLVPQEVGSLSIGQMTLEPEEANASQYHNIPLPDKHPALTQHSEVMSLPSDTMDFGSLAIPISWPAPSKDFSKVGSLILQLLGWAPSQRSRTMIQLEGAGSFYGPSTIFLLKEEGDKGETEEEKTESSDSPHPSGVLKYGLLETTDEEELEQEIKRAQMQEYQEFYLRRDNYI
ncbi:uncharacterized protein BT62DRAFT_924698 [Guyanagaster necrorhizus]|uniref:Uncharacterized protein n=1 Tax=Guyanagaster necrorhizus TaxID=856835 RepID=A0A9P8ALB3_9AGAR|nr:uncharacterized protein BT62DRAFT_924698 [Guyanagaster necrorhizus MCA 3950]KAG7439461.1 hypothetical protein BT62DRAFT_924698 [Guyanagaster necrorhizus MCA 3950]